MTLLGNTSSAKISGRVQNANINNFNIIHETLDLTVNGSVTPVDVTSDRGFSGLTRMIVFMEFVDQSIDFSGFDAGSVLANGIDFYYNDVKINETAIKNNGEFALLGYDVVILSDDQGAGQDNVLKARISFDKMSPNGKYLDMTRSQNFYVKVSDDLRIATRTAIVEFKVVLQGFVYT